jgi:hypothetical protein
MSCVAVPVVHVVDVVAVGDGLVAAALAVDVSVAVVGDMGVGSALVPMVIVLAVRVAVVQVVGVVAVDDGGVAAARRVAMVVAGVDLMGGGHRVFLSLAWVTASTAMRATWSS